MASFADRQDKGWGFGRVWKAVALATLGIASALAAPAMADTQGGADYLFPPTAGRPGPGVGVPTNPNWWMSIRNEYIYVQVGFAGSWATPTYNIPGRICVGNVGGSLRTETDDNINLCGSTDSGGTGTYPSSNGDDWPMYLQARVDGTDSTRANVGFNVQDIIQTPDFRPLSDGYAIVSEYRIGGGGGGGGGGALRIRQTIRLRRALARFEWVIINDDNTSHNVELRWNVRYRNAGNFYYADSRKGETDRTTSFLAADVPNDFIVYGRRAEEPTAPGAPQIPQYAARQVFKLFDATAPNRVYVLDSADLRPGDTTPVGVFDPYANGGRPLEFFRNGIATASYFSVSVPPGRQSSPIVTYFGNGAASDSVSSDFVTGVDGPESLIYNTEGAINPVVEANKTNPSVATIGAQFLTSDNPDPSNPRRFRIFATIYNQKLDRPEFGVALDGASASLTLPPGLRLAIDPATGQLDVASKTMSARAGTVPGRIDSDDEGIVSWWVEATGERYGALTYQVSVSVSEPSPLSRSVSRVINIPTPPIFSYQTGVFQMTGIPFEFDPVLSDNGLPATILNTNVAGTETGLILWEYIGNTNPNRFPPYRPATQIVPGKGYFYRPSIGINNQRVVYLKGARPTSSQAPVGNALALPRRIQLEPGWNLISNPYVYEIPLSYLRFLRNQDNPSLDKVTYQAAVASGLIRGGIYFYSPGDRSYQFLESFSNPLRPWQAYWIYANERVLLEYANPSARGVLIQPTPITPTNPDSEPATRKAANRDNDWQQRLVLRGSDGAQDRATFVGVSSGAKDSANLPKPPPLESYVYAGLVHEGSETRYASVVQAPGGKRVWELELSSDRDDNATLLWPEIARLPRRVQLSITDLQSGRTVHMRSAASLPVTLRKGAVSRYRITAQMASTQSLRITQLTTRATRSGSSIAVRLNKDATLTARVLTQGGRTVQVLAGSRATTAGQEVLLSWNGRDGSGTSLPAGGYIVEIVATGSEGDEPVRRTMLLSKLR